MNKILHGDCIKELKKINENSIDMIFADPPYFVSNGKFTVSSGKMNKEKINKGSWDKLNTYDEIYNFHFAWISECKRVLKNSGTIWISGTYHSIYICGEILQKLGFKILNDISWFKPNGAPNLSCRRFTASHETILWAIKDPKSKHIFNYHEMKEFPNDKIHNQGTQMRSVWSIPNTPKKEKNYGKHPTQKPEELLKRIILSSTNENNLILDPFLGSGTTCYVAKKLNRNYIGIELDQNYIDLAKRRING